jgi:nitric oxide reductase subunit B
MKINISLLFIFLAFVSLLASVFFGCIAALQYVSTTALDGFLSFQLTRPLHVSMVIAWIFSSALAGIYYYLPKIVKQEVFSKRLVGLHFIFFVLTGLVILYSYFTKSFGGREYWAFPTYLSIPILISWLFLIVNFFSTLVKYFLSSLTANTSFFRTKIPVYIWMWAVGILFFFFTFIESYLWLFPYFRENIVRDIMVQWKSYGSLVGSWNLLVYGIAIYVMDKISGKSSATEKMAYFLFFLGISNLILGWSHHIYILPTAKWIRYVGYAISMTELFILARMIWLWKKTIKFPEKGKYYLPYLFLVSADFWIVLNLVLAIIMSVPAFNIYTHGTHITVAHSMGSTIGINSMILLASIFYILYDCKVISEKDRNLKFVRKGFWIMNISLLIFWINLIGIGILKSYYSFQDLHHQQIMSLLSPYFVGFLIFGIGIFIGVLLIVLPILKKKNFISPS